MPKTVAILGASSDRSKYGNKSVRAHARAGWRVLPVNPRGGTIEGLPVFRSLREIPEKIDRVSIYLPPEIGLKALPEIAAAKPDEFFVNPGAESDALLDEARRLGLDPIFACSIVDTGSEPTEFP